MVKARALPCQTLILITALLMESKQPSPLIFFLSFSVSHSLFASTSHTFFLITLFGIFLSKPFPVPLFCFYVSLCHSLGQLLVCLIWPQNRNPVNLAHTYSDAASSSQQKSLPYWVKRCITGIPRFRGYVSVKPAAHCVTHQPVMDINASSAHTPMHTRKHVRSSRHTCTYTIIGTWFDAESLFNCVTLCAYSVLLHDFFHWRLYRKPIRKLSERKHLSEVLCLAYRVN